MSRQQLIEEIKQLSVADRVALIELISRSLREDLAPPSDDGPVPTELEIILGKLHPVVTAGQPTLSQRLSGILKFDGDPPTDEEVKDAYADHLLEKYS
ncbi:MAG TPA: hypothetical protein VK422_00100 [Pyrinomonadaceae bacterium]|nr:hypothetical protein [Pyrinomonadaceae bacterium]